MSLRRTDSGDREVLRRMLTDYLYEFDGTTEPYPYFDAYWSEPDRLPFLIEVDGKAVGFSLVRTLDNGWHIAEFTIVPARRRRGIGSSTVEELAELAAAAAATHLEAKVHPGNRDALDFWLAVGFEIVGEDRGIVTRREL